MKLFWAVVPMLLPIALIFAKNSMTNLQTVSIIAAFPIGFIILLIVWSFLRTPGSTWTKNGRKAGKIENFAHRKGEPSSPTALL